LEKVKFINLDQPPASARTPNCAAVHAERYKHLLRRLKFGTNGTKIERKPSPSSRQCFYGSTGAAVAAQTACQSKAAAFVQGARHNSCRSSRQPPNTTMKQQMLREYGCRYNLRVFVETGTCFGDTVAALQPDAAVAQDPRLVLLRHRENLGLVAVCHARHSCGRTRCP
jgi:hypothetical protein